MAQLYGCAPANGAWVVPGSHKLRRVDIEQMVADSGCGANRGRNADRLGYAVDARRPRPSGETSFAHQPHIDERLCYAWDDDARADSRDYNLEDLSI